MNEYIYVCMVGWNLAKLRRAILVMSLCNTSLLCNNLLVVNLKTYRCRHDRRMVSGVSSNILCGEPVISSSRVTVKVQV